MSTRQEETPKTYFKSNTATVRGLMSFLSIVFLIVVVGLCAYVLISYKGIRKNQDNHALQYDYVSEGDKATIVGFYDTEATKCVIPEIITGKNNQIYKVVALGENAFTNHRNLTEVEIPNSVTHIMGNTETKKGAFSGCVNLQKVTMKNNILNIGAYAFKNCISLKSIQIPSSVQFVEESAFLNCLSLDTIQLDSNGTLGANCFANCINVTTLKLADQVELNVDARKSFSGLPKLTKFIISDKNPSYYYDTTANCLLSTTNVENDTLVLAGCETVIPVSVTKILDWAWGERAVNNLYIPNTVIEIASNAFNNQSICTNASSKPISWLTSVPVYFNAQFATFRAKGEEVSACVYTNEGGNRIEPIYSDLFPNLKTTTPFVGWNKIDDATYEALYESETKSNKYLALNSSSGAAWPYLNDLSVCAMFKIDFWEDFKSVYYRAVALNVADTYDYIVDNYIGALKEKMAIADHSDSNYVNYLEDSSWSTRLEKLVNSVDLLEKKDFLSQSGAAWEDMKELAIGSKDVLASSSNDAALKTMWEGLRNAYEKLVADISESSPLGQLITKCENLERSNYSKDSWDNLQKCLRAAHEITEHNQSVSVVRKNLDTAFRTLQEIGIEEDLAKLESWISICNDLNVEDYQEGECDKIAIKVAILKNKLDTLVTRNSISQEIGDLKNSYNQLKLLKKEEPEATIVMIAINTLPYFIIAAILFTGAVVAGSLSGGLKRKMRNDAE